MADDAILRETKQSIDRLFAQVAGGAGSASQGLYDVGRATRTAESGLGSLSGATEQATRSAGSFVTAVRRIESTTADYTTTLSSSVSKLEKSLGATVHSVTGKIDETLSMTGSTVGLIGMLGKGIIKAPAAFGTFLTSLKGGSTSIGKLAKSVAGGTKAVALSRIKWIAMAATLGTVEDYVDDSFKTWKFLSTAGITLGNNLNNVGAIAGRTRLDFDEFAAALSQASPALAKVGGTADQGAKTLVAMQEAMMDTVESYGDSGESYNKTLKMMGVGPKESMSLLSSLMEDQTFAAKLRGMQDGVDGTRRAEITGEYIAQLDQLSKLTGKSREQLAKEMAQKAQDAQFSATLLDMDVDQANAAKKQLAFIENTYGKDAAELFKARLAGVVPTGDGARKLFATSLGGVINDMASETSSTGGAAAGQILSQHMGDLGAAALETRDMLKPLALAGGLVSSSFGSLYNATNEATLKNQALIETLGKNVTGMDRLTEAIDNAYNMSTGVEVVDGQRVRGDETRLLQSKVALQTIADLAGTAVNAWMSGIGWQGGKVKQAGAGWAMEGARVGYEAIISGVETATMTNIELAATGGGTRGEGRGQNVYDYDKIIRGLFGAGNNGIDSQIKNAAQAQLDLTEQSTQVDAFGDYRRREVQAQLGQTGELATSAETQITNTANQIDKLAGNINSQITDEALKTGLSGKLGQLILNSPMAEEQVRATLADLNVSSGRIDTAVKESKMTAAMDRTNKSRNELLALQETGPGGMGGMKDLREVTANIQNATMQNNMDAQKLADAKLINGPIVDQLKLMLAELRKDDIGAPEGYADKNGKHKKFAFDNIVAESSVAGGPRAPTIDAFAFNDMVG